MVYNQVGRYTKGKKVTVKSTKQFHSSEQELRKVQTIILKMECITSVK